MISSPLRLDIEVSGLMSRVAVRVRLLLSRRLCHVLQNDIRAMSMAAAIDLIVIGSHA